MKNTGKILLLFCTAIAFIGCSTTKELSKAPGDLYGNWTLSSMSGTQVQSSANYTLSFNVGDNVAGKAGCNYYTGDYNAQQEGKIDISGVNATKLDCGSDTNYQSFLKGVKNANSFEVRNGTVLVLNTGDGTLEFNKELPEGEEG